MRRCMLARVLHSSSVPHNAPARRPGILPTPLSRRGYSTAALRVEKEHFSDRPERIGELDTPDLPLRPNHTQSDTEASTPRFGLARAENAFIADWKLDKDKERDSAFSLKSPRFDIEASRLLLDIPANTTITHDNFPPYSLRSIYTAESLLHTLENANLDSRSVIIMAHLVKTSVPYIPYQTAGRILHCLLKRCCASRMLSMIPSIVNIFFQRVQLALKNGDIGGKDTQLVYTEFIEGFRSMHLSPRTSTRRQDFKVEDWDYRSEVVRIVRHLIDVLRSLPGSSRQTSIPLEPELMSVITRNRVMSNQLFDAVYAYAKESNTKIQTSDLEGYFKVAVREGNVEQAERLLKLQSRVHKAGDPTSTNAADVSEVVEKLQYLARTDLSLSMEDKAAFERATKKAKMVSSFAKGSFDDFAQIAQPYLANLSPDPMPDVEDERMREHVWSMLLSRVVGRKNVTAAQVLDIYRYLPRSCVCAHTHAPIIRGLMRLNALDEAWTIWQDAETLAESAKGVEDSRRYIDKVLLAIGTELCAKKFGLNMAVELVDTHARHRHSDLPQEEVKIQLDNQNVAVLIWQCVIARSPSIALRIFNAAFPRWSVKPDGIALGMLLNLARTCEFDATFDSGDENLGAHFRSLMEEFSLRRSERSSYDGANIAKAASNEELYTRGDHRVLLDPTGYKWSKEYGNVRPWKYMRNLFRSIVFDNWPELTSSSPLELEHGILGSFGGSLGGRLKVQSNTNDEHLTSLPDPESTGSYTHVIPTPLAWHHYILLLGTFGLVREIPIALNWMKSIGIKPLRHTLRDSLMYVAEVEGPRRYVQWRKGGKRELARDEEILRRWMEDWLGEGMYTNNEGQRMKIVPDEKEVRGSRVTMAVQGRKLMM